jgi:hypothetical protein
MKTIHWLPASVRKTTAEIKQNSHSTNGRVSQTPVWGKSCRYKESQALESYCFKEKEEST